jgi:Gnt-I system high-affinity gluconate transporter
MTLLIIVLAIALQVFLTMKKISPFLSLLIVAVIAGLALGMVPGDLLKSIEKGVGSTLGGLALIITLGAILGKILEESGAAERITTTLIKGFGEKNIQWAIMLTGFLVGIPLYYNAGFVILVPMVFSLAKKTGLPLLYIAIPMAAALSTTHCFLPPHPGPVVLINAFKADIGKVLLYGIIIALPVSILAGPVLGKFMTRIKATMSEKLQNAALREESTLPANLPSFAIALLPVILISCSVAANTFLEDGTFKNIILFFGDANIALLLAVIVAVYVFGVQRGVSVPQTMQWLNDAIASISVILLIITAGGVFKQVLTDSGTATYISNFASQWNMPPLIFAWIVTALLRVTIGSATVAGITAAGVVSPIVAAGGVSPELMVLAVGTGSVFGSHINDTGFWMFKEFFNLNLKQTFQSWTVMESLISVLGIIGVLILSMFVG